ncbi:MAG: sarcosine oxidase subunit gamma [Rhodobacteraceae bacterium]|nr:sarcosine oxidase subunit gamma [Paracoccaceae bacterium]
MAEFNLTAEPFLKGYHRQFDGVGLVEAVDLRIASFACPAGAPAQLEAQAKTGWGIELPAPGASSGSLSNQPLVLGMSPDQWFALFAGQNGYANDKLLSVLGATAYITDQTHNWVALKISGKLARTALERICPIDLDPNRFVPGTVARTLMEHLGCIIFAAGEDEYLLLSASSSANSFLHAVEQSIHNIL